MKTEGFDLNDRVEGAIAAALASRRFPHAVIIEGGSAVERLALAQKTASALVCSSEFKIPCGECGNCKKAAAGFHPDILLYSVENKPRAFKIELAREIRSKAYVAPNEADAKVFILENADAMGTETQNAILKILEEPPERVSFILLCSSKSKFRATVLSRATVYSLDRTPASYGEDSALKEAAADAAMRIASSVIAENEIEIVKAAAALEKDPKLTRDAISVTQEIFAAALRIKYSADDANPEFGEIPKTLARKLGSRSILALVKSCEELSAAIRLNANRNLTVTAVCVKLRAAAGV